MLNPVRTAQKGKKFPSFGATARALLKTYPENKWGIKSRSLETQIGKLDKGDITWWTNHAEIAQALAELLELTLQDLGLHGNESETPGFVFSEFPGLKPLDLKREKPWKIGIEESDEKRNDSKFGKPTLREWLDPEPTAWRAPYDLHWLHIADALERRLLTRHLAATSRYKVVFTDTLEMASAQLQDVKPLILVVEGDVSEEDFKTLGLRDRFAGLLVIAPKAVPVRQETDSLKDMRWERMSLQREERRQFDLAAPGDIKCWAWTLQPDWRAGILKWVEKRLDRHEADTLFDAQSMGLWLERFDPLGHWFETTADVLHLCEIGHLQSHKKLPKPNDVQAGDKLTRLLFSNKSSKRGDQIKQWAVARWSRLDLAWRGTLPMVDWLLLLPASQLPPTSEEVLAIASAKTALERKKTAARVIGLLEAGNPEALRASGLLKEDATGQLDFEHPTLVRLIVRDKLMQQIAEEPAPAWALACFDTDRSLLVDAALDVLSLDALMRAVQRLLLEDANNANSAAALGASEALFVALGRRITNREVIDDQFLPLLMQLASTVTARLDLEASAYSLPMPWSRLRDTPAQQLAWIGTCWAWSFQVKAPDKQVDELPSNWLFPGWSESLPPSPDWLNHLWPEGESEQLGNAWKYFFKVADEWVKNWDQPLDNPPRILKPALLGRAAHGAWAAEQAWWKDLIAHETPWAAGVLLVQFEAAGKSAAARLWPSFLAFEMANEESGTMSLWIVQLSPVRLWLLARLLPDEVLAGLTPKELNHLSSFPQILPPAFRAPLLLARCQHISFESFADIEPFIARFGPEVLPALPELLTHDWLGSAAAKYLWAWDGSAAERLLHDDATDFLARHHLINACPANKTALAAAVLLENPALCADYSFWARDRLPTAGINAQALVEIIRFMDPG